jgi:anti-sigma factor RsiW
MNHPNDEQWMSYLYDELDSAGRASLKAHLKSCGECKSKVAAWQATKKNLSTWRLPAARSPRTPPIYASPVLKWAVAALFLCAGIVIGRLTPATVSAQKIRAEVEPQLRQEFAQMLREELSKSVTATLQSSGEQTKGMLANYAAAAETNRATDNAAILTALNKLSEQRITDYLLLKKDVDTVAVNTDLGFRSTQQELNQLADYPLPGNAPNLQQPK